MDELLQKFSLLTTEGEVKGISEGLQDIKEIINNLGAKINSLESRLDKLEAEVFLKRNASNTPVEHLRENQ